MKPELQLEQRPDAAADGGVPRWFSEAIAAAPEASFIELPGKSIETLVWGREGAPGLLLIHGNTAHARWWSFIAPFFADRFRVVAFSLSGMGASTHQPPYSLESYADEAVAIAGATGLLGGAPLSVVGHSAGGGVTALLAAREDITLDRAIMIDSLIAPGEPVARTTDRPFRVYPDFEDAVSRYRLVPEQPESNAFIIDWLARHSLRQVEGGWTWSSDPQLKGRLAARRGWDYIPRARCPLIFLNGSRSGVMTADRIAALRDHAPGARFFTLPEAHHHVLVDQPLALVAVLAILLEPAGQQHNPT